MIVRYLGPFAQPTGFGQACCDYLKALATSGVELDIDPILEADFGSLPDRYRDLLYNVNINAANDPDVYIVHAPPQFVHHFAYDEYAPPAAVPRVAVTAWETTKLPETVLASINENFTATVVPSRFVAEVFNGTATVIPHCFDPKFWSRPIPAKKSSTYVFYSVLVWAERKNPIGLLKAYFASFTEKDDVLLRIVTPNYSREDVEALKAGMCLESYPRVEFIDERVSDLRLWEIHATSDCYVTTTRGEGWGLGAFEACLVGNPVIAPRFGGMVDFLNDYLHKFYIPVTLTPVITPEPKAVCPPMFAGHTLQPLANTPPPLGLSADQDWAEPDLGSCMTYMQQAFKEKWDKWPLATKRMFNLYSYEAVGAQFKNFLEGL